MTTVTDPAVPVTTLFDARTFARGWMSVAVASGKDEARPVLNRTIAVELHPGGARLIATDSHVLLHAWIPADLGDEEPGLDEPPAVLAVAADPHGRAKSLMAYLINLTGGEDPPLVDLTVTIGPADDPDDDNAFEGFGRTAVFLEVPDQERLTLHTIEAPFPDWRTIVHAFTPEKTNAVALRPDLVANLGKLGKYHDDKPLLWRFGGVEKAALVEVADTIPHVAGVVMPMRFPWADDPDAD